MFQFTHPAWGATGLLLLTSVSRRCFNSRTPRGVRHLIISNLPIYLLTFQFTHPAWGATQRVVATCEIYKVSIHAPRVGCDCCSPSCGSPPARFQFTHPAWGATPSATTSSATPHVSIHAPRVGCDKAQMKLAEYQYGFNSRTPRGVRLHRHANNRRHYNVSIHAPRVGCDRSSRILFQYGQRFNSRTPRGVRQTSESSSLPALSFNSRTPRGVRRLHRSIWQRRRVVSIHAPRVGCDWLSSSKITGECLFQFTHPAWGATDIIQHNLFGIYRFNSRTPRGVRQMVKSIFVRFGLFQFTHPAWGATCGDFLHLRFFVVFQFTHPAWGATFAPAVTSHCIQFQFTHPAWGATPPELFLRDEHNVSIHAPRVGCDGG